MGTRNPFDFFLGLFLRGVLLLGEDRGQRVWDEGTGAANGVRIIPLFHPRCRQAARHDRRFTLGRDDLLDPAPGRHHVVRAMNASVMRGVLGAGFTQFLRRHFANLVPGGLLVLGYNVDAGSGPIKATILERGGDRFRVARELRGGAFRREMAEAERMA
jgi:hypothetical protein